MIFKQELRTSLKELLENSEVFCHVRINGIIDNEGEELTIEYRKAKYVSRGDFHFCKNKLEKRIKEVGEYFFPRLSFTFEGPNKSESEENYRIVFKNQEGGYRNLTFDLLKKLREQLSNRYLFRN